MKFRKTENAYTSGKNKFLLDTCEAWSYGWWQYVRKYGKFVVFNNYNYSSTTNGHQSETRSLLRKHGIKIDLMVSTHAGLHQEWEREEIERLHRIVFLSEYKLSKKGTRPDKAKALQADIKEAKAGLKKMQRFKVKVTKADLKALEASTRADEDERLADNREKSAKLRAIRAAAKAENKEELESLEPVKIFDTLDKVNDLKAI